MLYCKRRRYPRPRPLPASDVLKDHHQHGNHQASARRPLRRNRFVKSRKQPDRTKSSTPRNYRENCHERNSRGSCHPSSFTRPRIDCPPRHLRRTNGISHGQRPSPNAIKIKGRWFGGGRKNRRRMRHSRTASPPPPDRLLTQS